MKITKHAQERWSERFPRECMETSLTRARRTGRILKKKIKESCPAHKHLLTSGFKGYYYTFDDRLRACFVWEAPETLVTVFRLE